MAPVRVLRLQRAPPAQKDESEVEEPLQPGSPSSDDDQITKLATEMQREVLCLQASALGAMKVDSLLGQKTSRGSTYRHQ